MIDGRAMRALVTIGAVACAGCSLFLLDGLNEDAPPSADAGSDTAATSDGGSANDATTSPDAVADAKEDGSVAGNDPYGDAVRADGPIGWWRLDEAAGATAAQDSSGKSVAATFANPGGISVGQPGAMTRGKAYVFDGASGLLLGDRFSFPSPAQHTFEMWVKPNLPPGDTGYHGVFGKITFTPSPKNGRYFYYYLPTPRIGFEEWDPGGQNTLFATHTMTLPPEQFTHVVVTFDGALPRVYVDGVLTKTGTKTGDLPDNDLSFQWADGWIGALDELAIYDKALDPLRVKAHFDAAKQTN